MYIVDKACENGRVRKEVERLSVSVMQAGVTCTSFLTTQLESDIYIWRPYIYGNLALQLSLSSCVVRKLVQVTPACITLTDNM